MFRRCSRYVSFVLQVCFDRARGLFRLRSNFVSTVLEMCFNRLRNLSVVGRGMFRPSREVFFDYARVVLAAMVEICFDRPQSMFRPSSKYVSTGLRYVSTMHEVYFDCRSRYVSTVLEICFAPARSLVRPSLEVCFDLARAMFRPCSRYF